MTDKGDSIIVNMYILFDFKKDAKYYTISIFVFFVIYLHSFHGKLSIFEIMTL